MSMEVRVHIGSAADGGRRRAPLDLALMAVLFSESFSFWAPSSTRPSHGR